MTNSKRLVKFNKGRLIVTNYATVEKHIKSPSDQNNYALMMGYAQSLVAFLQNKTYFKNVKVKALYLQNFEKFYFTLPKEIQHFLISSLVADNPKKSKQTSTWIAGSDVIFNSVLKTLHRQ